MFEDTLLIIKSDYLHKRKAVLLKLLGAGFHIQGHRKLLFSPEHAAEFYKESAEDSNFMLQVILLSKGNCEAFILTKENAVEELMNTMICYFVTSMEMELNVHVTRLPKNVRREISFIFPNYINEPIPDFQAHQFNQQSLIVPMIEKVCDIVQYGLDGGEQQNWRMQLSEWLTMSNKALPHISNQCSLKPIVGYEDKGQQTVAVASFREDINDDLAADRPPAVHSHSTIPTSGSLASLMSSSSCVTCSCFDGTGICLHPPPEKKTDPDVEYFKAKTIELPKSSSSEILAHGAGIVWEPLSEASEGGEETIDVEFAEHGELDLQPDAVDIQSHHGDDAAIIVEGDVPRNSPKDQANEADVGADIGSEVGTEVDTKVVAEVGTEVGAEMGAEMGAEIGAEVVAEVGAEVGAEMGADVGPDAAAVVGAKVGAEVNVVQDGAD